jgi:hypothetical protein
MQSSIAQRFQTSISQINNNKQFRRRSGTRRSSSSSSNNNKNNVIAMAANKAQSKPKILSRAEKLGLLGKAVTTAEGFGLISLVENTISLSQIEKLGLLSTGEKILYDRQSPGTIATLGYVLAIGAALAVYTIPDDSTGLVILQALLAVTGVVGFAATSVISSTLADLQK